MNQTQAQVSPERIARTAWAYAAPILVDAAVELGLFDTLDNNPQTAAEAAGNLNISVRGAVALADALTGAEFLQKDADGRYHLVADTAQFLVRGKQAYYGPFFHHIRQDLIPGWLKLADVVRTGHATQHVESSEESAAFFEDFVPALFALSYAPARVLAADLDLNRRNTEVRVLDVAAGSGVWGIALAESCPRVTVTAVDWEGVLRTTRKTVDQRGLGNRFRYVAGDIATADFGHGHAVATLGHILHSEGRERSRKLIRRVFEALEPGGVIAISEFVPNAERTGPAIPLLFAVNMLINTTAGDVYTFEEMRGWLTEAGFRNVRQLEAPAPSPLILANKP
ncbi:MAG: methyltransferase domain-containing protein [Bryobacterales bacterium]|nr:methyltransferase domain-containing protein [Bryobacterales bacterium]